MKIQFLVFASLVVLYSCGSQEQTSDVQSDADAFAFRSYQMNLNAPQVKFPELIDEIHIVQLEETDASLLGGVSNVKLHEDFIYFSQFQDNALYFFSDQGKFINKINRQGEGPEEYQALGAYWMSGDTVKVFDRPKNKILSYNLSGDFLASQSLPRAAAHVLPTQTGYWLDISHRLVPDSAQFEIVHLNKNMESPEYHLPANSTFGPTLMSSNNNFKRLGEKVLYKHNFKDTLYAVQDDKVDPFIHFDFGNEYLWSDKDLRTNINAAFEAMQKAGKVWLFQPYVGEKHIFLSYTSDFESQKLMVMDRETGKMVRIDTENSEGEPLLIAPNSWNGESFLMILSSLDLVGLLEPLDPAQYSFEEGSSLEGIESSENPALVRVKFKMPN